MTGADFIITLVNIKEINAIPYSGIEEVQKL